MSEEGYKMLTVRADKELIDRFIETCKANDTTASMEVRKFMKDYLAKNGQRDWVSEGKKK